MILDQNCFVAYQDEYSVLPHPNAYVRGDSTYTVIDSSLGDGAYSIQFNVDGQKYELQNVLLVSRYENLFWDVQLWERNGPMLISKNGGSLIPMLDANKIALKYNPILSNRAVFMDFDVESQTASITLVKETGEVLSKEAYSLDGYCHTPRLMDMSLCGFSGGSVARFAGFGGAGYMNTGARYGVQYVNYVHRQVPQYPTIANLQWYPTGEGSSLKQDTPSLGSSSVSFRFS